MAVLLIFQCRNHVSFRASPDLAIHKFLQEREGFVFMKQRELRSMSVARMWSENVSQRRDEIKRNTTQIRARFDQTEAVSL